MKQAKAVFPIFFLFTFITLIILFFFQNPLVQPLQAVTMPVQKWLYTTVSPQPQNNFSTEEKLQKENNELRTKLAGMQELERENHALRNQFEMLDQSPKDLVAATIIGTKRDVMIIDKGQQDGIALGDVVVVQDNVIGKISQISPRISVIQLIVHPSTSFTAIIPASDAIGVVKADNGVISLENIVQSDEIAKDDIVVTKGSVDEKGVGYPPGLVVGKVASINKKDSDLFQSAKIDTLVNYKKLRTVFVMKQ